MPQNMYNLLIQDVLVNREKCKCIQITALIIIMGIGLTIFERCAHLK